MADLPATPPACEHAYEHRKGPRSRLWVKVCQLCDTVDWADLNAQLQEEIEGSTRSMQERSAALQRLVTGAEQEITALRQERDRLRTAWMSARGRAASAREATDSERFFAREFGSDVVRLRRQVKELTAERDRLLAESAASIIRDVALPPKQPARPEGVCVFGHVRCAHHPAKTMEERIAALEELTDLLADIVERHSRALEPGQKQPPADS